MEGLVGKVREEGRRGRRNERGSRSNYRSSSFLRL